MVQTFTLPERTMLRECEVIANDPDATARESHLARLLSDVICDVARHRVAIAAIQEVANLDLSDAIARLGHEPGYAKAKDEDD